MLFLLERPRDSNCLFYEESVLHLFPCHLLCTNVACFSTPELQLISSEGKKEKKQLESSIKFHKMSENLNPVCIASGMLQ